MLESIVPQRLNESIETVVSRDKTIDIRPNQDFERLFIQAKHEASEMEQSVDPVYQEFKSLTLEKIKDNDEKYVKQLVSDTPHCSKVFVGRKHGENLYTGRMYELIGKDITYSVYGIFSLEKNQNSKDTYSAHGICRVEFESLKQTHLVDHRFMKMKDNKLEHERLEVSYLIDGSKQYQWMIGGTPSRNHPTFFINEKGTLRISHETKDGVFRVYCVRHRKEVDSIEMYFVDHQNNVFEKYEQVKYDSQGRYFHRTSGSGTCVLNPNLRYEGHLRAHFEMTGHGRMITIAPSKTVSGAIQYGIISYGEVKTDDYSYEGEIRDGLPNGKGRKQFRDKDYGIGEFKDGVQVGKGQFYSNCCQSLYDGEFIDGHKSGHGTEVFENGDKYEGEFKDGKFSGKGEMKFSNGDVYKGDFNNGVFHGEGELKTSETTINCKWTHGKIGERNEEHVRICCAGHMSPVSKYTKVN